MLNELKEANEYIRPKIGKADPLLREMKEFAKERHLPVMSIEVEKYLEFMVELNETEHILDIGTGIGYSAIVMLNACKKYEGTLTTIDIDREMIRLAGENFRRAGVDDRVFQIWGDGSEIKKTYGQLEYDFIYMDASREGYKTLEKLIILFEDSYRLLMDGGVVFIDNLMFNGYLYKRHPKSAKAVVRNLDRFIDYLYAEYPGFTLLPFGNGIGLIRKVPDNASF